MLRGGVTCFHLRQAAGAGLRTAVRCLAVAFAFAWGTAGLAAADLRLPEIRLSGKNQVPACVTPERLMAFLRKRNTSLDPRFADIAKWYRHYGEAWRVRWDYAFFQMLIETNFLSYRRGNGRMGDVDPRQNNFAGIGTTGGGVPGDGFPDVKTGVLAQIQHLVAYSGERVVEPVAHRTRLKQADIVSASLKLGRPVRFSDLARRWAVDQRYGHSIEWVAARFRDAYCHPAAADTVPAEASAPERLPWAPPELVQWSAATTLVTAPPPKPVSRAAKVPAPAAAAGTAKAPAGGGRDAALFCQIATASYGGTRTVLIRSAANGAVRYTALSVLDGFEDSMTANFIREKAPGGEEVGRFPTAAAALSRARELCPGK